MNRIKKQLKEEAAQMLPSSETKKKIKDSIFAQEPVGEEQSAPQKRKYAASKVWVRAAVAFALVLSVSLGLAFGLQSPGNGIPVVTDTFVSIDINPSFEIIADSNDVVKSVTPLNNDGVIVLYGTSYVGKSLDEVCAAIVATAIDLEYINVSHNDVKLLTANNDGGKEKSVANALKQTISQTLSQRGSNATVTIKNNDKNGKQELLDEASSQLNLAVLGITEEELENMSVAQINKLLKQYNAKDIDDLEDILEDLYEKAGLDPDDDEFEDQMDELKKNWKKEHGDNDDDDDDDDDDNDSDDDD